MRTHTLLVTRRCNQRCGFCDRVDPAAADLPLALLLRDIARAHAEGARSLVLTGGEPTLRADLLELVRAAHRAGIPDVVLATNATRLTPAAALALREAGLTAAVVSVVTTTPDHHRSLVSDTTHPAHILRGMTALLDAGLRLTIRLPLAQDLPPAAARLHGLKRAVPRLERFTLAVIGPGESTLRPEQALSTTDLSREIAEAYDAADKLDVALALDPEHPALPCTVPLPPRARRLFATLLRDQDGVPNQACNACSSCGLAGRCTVTAAQLARSAGPPGTPGGRPIHPIEDAAAFSQPGKNPGTRLRVLGKEDVDKFFLVHYDYGAQKVDIPTSRLGILYRCNQVCTFCELADMDTEVDPARVRAGIDEARARGSVRLILTGGEPTLSHHLVDHVRHAKQAGIAQIELQTNAVLLDKPAFADALAQAGLTSAQISLHGPNAEVSDRLTAAPGTHARTLRGIDHLLAAGVRCLLNHLIFRDNCHLLVDFVEMVHARWGQHKDRLVIQFHSPRNEFTSREAALRHIARYSDYAPLLRQAIDRARALGIATHDLQDPTGIPALCVLGADEAYLGRIAAQSERPRFHAWESDWLTRVEACKSCDLAGACMGIPRPYLALHGDSEFVALRRQPVSSAPAETEGDPACSAPP
jgi:molybdenum cofactor biosynthesis enzyme MoaA